MRTFGLFFVCLAFFAKLYAVDASLEIIKGVFSSPKLVVENYSDGTLGVSELNSLSTMIMNDVKVSDHFAVIENSARPGFDSKPDFALLTKSGTQVVLKYKVSKQGQSINIDAKLYDTSRPTDVSIKRVSISSWDRYPFLSHKLAIELNSFVKAPPIDWMDRFVVFSKSIAPKKTDIVIADYTLTYQKTLISGGYNMFPKWASKNQQAIYYTAYEDNMVLYRYDIYGGKKIKITSSAGMLVCSDVSQDEKKLLLTMAPSGLPDIFLFELGSGQKKNLTNFSGIDVSGSFVDNDQKIAFVSDRLGYPSIFLKALEGNAVEQLIYGGKNTSFHAKDNLIAYSAKEGGANNANLYIFSIKNQHKKQLTAGGINSSPKFAGSGEAIMFLKNDSGKTYLGVVRLGSGAVFLFPVNIGKIKSFDW